MKRFLVFIIAIALVLPHTSAFASDVDPLERIAELEEQLKEREERIAELENQVSVLLDLVGKSSKEEKEPERIKLTVDNLEDYLSISKRVTASSVRRDPDGFALYTVTGSAAVNIGFVNQSNAKFENVRIKVRLRTWMNTDSQDQLWGWDFSSGNKRYQSYEITESYGFYYSYKDLDISLPYDGNYNWEEKLEIYYPSAWAFVFWDPHDFESSDFMVEILSVSGDVIKE